LLINDPLLVERAEIIREKGTNRSNFFRGQVDKYTWVDIGSSYLPGEITAAFLWSQMQEADLINIKRLDIWNRYHEAFAVIERTGRITRPFIPESCNHNAHMYYLILANHEERSLFIEEMKSRGINCVSHYEPLHSSPLGISYQKKSTQLNVTSNLSSRIVRLPFWINLHGDLQEAVINAVKNFFDISKAHN
jgi:dTDP-4-amino-4,6-dideoxygalactose transaminase